MINATKKERLIASFFDFMLMSFFSYAVFSFMFIILTGGSVLVSYNYELVRIQAEWYHELTALFFVVILYIFYFFICLILPYQRTLGQLIVGIGIYRYSEKSVKYLLIRSIIPVTSFLMFPLFWIDRETGQTYYDKWSNSKVIKINIQNDE